MNVFLRVLSYVRPYLWREVVAYASTLGMAAASLSIPVLIGNMVDRGITGGDLGYLNLAVLLVLGLALARGVLTFLQGYLTESVSQGIAYDMRNQLYDKLQRLSFSYYDQAETGQLLARATSDVGQIRRITGRGLIMLVDAVIITLGTSAVLISISPLLAVVTLAGTPLLVVVVRLFGREIRPLSLARQNQLARLTSKLEQNLKGLAVVRDFAQERAEIGRFRDENDRLYGYSLEMVDLRARRNPQIRLLSDISIILLVGVGGLLVVRGTITLGELVAFQAYLLTLMPPLRRLGSLTPMLSASVASAERVFEVLDVPEEVQDRPGARPLPPLKGHVRFDQVSFGYGHSHPVLDRVSFEVQPGTVAAILGPTGSGKSTIINLLLRFYDVSSGKVLVDGYDVRDVTRESLRGQIGVVLQEPMLVAGSIRDNIAFGRPDATDEEVERVSRLAAAHDFVSELPHGYGTPVGEQGAMLSGGQRQRIAIARAILTDPAILVLDDATSSVDSNTEIQIQDALWELMPGRTSFVIAQRVSTARRADVVLVMDQGKLVDMGTHEELLSRCGLYGDIFRGQLLPESEEEGDDGRSPACPGSTATRDDGETVAARQGQGG